MDLNIGAEYDGFRAEFSGFLAQNRKSERLGNKDAQDAFRRAVTGSGMGTPVEHCDRQAHLEGW